MNIYRIMSDKEKSFFCIYKGITHNGVIYMWEYVGEVQYEFNAIAYIRRNGREYDPKRDKVSSLVAI